MTLRSSSIVLAILSVFLPGIWYAYMEWSFEKWASTQEGEFVCGVPMLGALFLSCIVAMLLSALGLVPGVAAFKRIPSPRSRARMIELGVIGAPLLLCGLFLGGLILLF